MLSARSALRGGSLRTSTRTLRIRPSAAVLSAAGQPDSAAPMHCSAATPRRRARAIAASPPIGVRRFSLFGNLFGGGSGPKPLICPKLDDINQIFTIGRELGAGQFGKVMVGTDRKTGKDMAVKSIEKGQLADPEQDKASLVNEIQILRQMKHPNTMDLFGVYEDARHIYIASSMCHGGELFDRLLDRGSFTEQDAAVILQQLLAALEYCHSLGIMHRDIKPENILMKHPDHGPASRREYANPDEDPSLQVVLVDFGVAKPVMKGEHVYERVGSVYYMAPEMVARDATDKSDVWSVGVVMYMLLSGEMPFGGDNDEQVMARIRDNAWHMRQPCWQHISLEAKQLLKQLLTHKDSQRPSASEALKHPWLVKRGMGNVTPLPNSVTKALSDFQSSRQLKRAALGVIAKMLDGDATGTAAVQELRQVFQDLDKDGNGTLDMEEFTQAMLQLQGTSSGGASKSSAAGGIVCKTEAEAKEWFRTIDSDHSGSVDIHEFIVAAMDKQMYAKRETLAAAFMEIDADKSGAIDREELQAILEDDVDADAVLKELRKGPDEQITFPEFERIMRTNTMTDARRLTSDAPKTTS